MIPNQDSSAERSRSRSRSRPNLKPIVLIGDSIIKHIDPVKLSKKYVHKATFPGYTAEQIADSLESITIQHPSHVIIHAGTNNLTSTDTAESCADKIMNLVETTKRKFPNSKIAVSGITHRSDIDVTTKYTQVNEALKRSATTLKTFNFIDNSVIDQTGLNGSKLHLNAKGTALLATQFIKFLRPQTKGRNNRKDFQQVTTLQDLGHLLINLGRPQRRQPARGRRGPSQRHQ